MLTILDEYTRECHVLRADRALRSGDLLEWLGRAVKEHGAPQYLRSDNGSEFIATEVQKWLKSHQIKTIYIDPGSPWQNGFVESFHGRCRDEWLNREQLWTSAWSSKTTVRNTIRLRSNTLIMCSTANTPASITAYQITGGALIEGGSAGLSITSNGGQANRSTTLLPADQYPDWPEAHGGFITTNDPAIIPHPLLKSYAGTGVPHLEENPERVGVIGSCYINQYIQAGCLLLEKTP